VKIDYKVLAKDQSKFNRETPAKAGGNSVILRGNLKAARF
jgi:hypothetical protein